MQMKMEWGTRFSEIPHEARMYVREIVDDLGGAVAGYSDANIVVAMPNDHRAHVMREMLRAIGLAPTESCLFPLGSDDPPEHLRHLGGYWRYQRFTLPAAMRKAKIA